MPLQQYRLLVNRNYNKMDGNTLSTTSMDKFGRVFLSQESQDEPLQYACFSNLDWKWYNPVGDIHKDFQTYRNNPVSVGLSLEVTNKLGTQEKVEVKVKLPFVLKDLPAGPSKEYLLLAKQHELDVAKKFEILGMLIIPLTHILRYFLLPCENMVACRDATSPKIIDRAEPEL